MDFRELSFSRLECGVTTGPVQTGGIFYFPWHRHQIEVTDGFQCLIRKTQRYTISNVESQVFTPNNVPGPGSESRSAACQADVLTTTLPRLLGELFVLMALEKYSAMT